MNKIFFLLLFLNTSEALSLENPTPQPAPTLADSTKNLKNQHEEKFEKLFYFLENKINNIEKEMKTMEQKDLVDDEDVVFCVFQYQKISDIMFIVNHGLLREINSSKKEEKEFLQKKIIHLMQLRKKHAFNFKNFIEKFKNVKLISNKEKERLIDKIETWNKNQELKND